mmetsp:Transcript_4807/g.8969  ORF Transcript_4807/g.8969 Transcript_4807/m.8969 type:complete len:274 (-) Transcript_4807:87-908(-)
MQQLPQSASIHAIGAFIEIYMSKEASHIFSCRERSNMLFAKRLDTGTWTSLVMPSYSLKFGCAWCEVPVGILYFTGGSNSSDVVAIDSKRDMGVLRKPSMNSERQGHASIYFQGCLYIIGGYRFDYQSECERLILGEIEWQLIESIPESCFNLSVVSSKETQCIYAIGGYQIVPLNLIQSLSVETLTWAVLPVKLPFPQEFIAAFKLDESQVFFIEGQTLFKFNFGNWNIERVKALSDNISSLHGPSYYSRGRVYCSNCNCSPKFLEVGALIK